MSRRTRNFARKIEQQARKESGFRGTREMSLWNNFLSCLAKKKGVYLLELFPQGHTSKKTGKTITREMSEKKQLRLRRYFK